jgi:hypothetical protein
MEQVSNYLSQRIREFVAPRNMEQQDQPKPETLQEQNLRIFVDRVVASSTTIPYETETHSKYETVRKGFKLDEHGTKMVKDHSEAIGKKASLRKLMEEDRIVREMQAALDKDAEDYQTKKAVLKSLSAAVDARIRYKVIDKYVDATTFIGQGEDEQEKQEDIKRQKNEKRGEYHNNIVALAKRRTSKEKKVRAIDIYKDAAKEILDAEAQQPDIRKRRTFLQHAAYATAYGGATVLLGYGLSRLILGDVPIASAASHPTAAPTTSPMPGAEPAITRSPSPRPEAAPTTGTATRTPDSSTTMPEPTGTPTATSTQDTATAAPEPTSTATQENPTTVPATAERPEGLVNSEMYAGSVNLEKDFTITVSDSIAQLTDIKQRDANGNLSFSVESVPLSKRESGGTDEGPIPNRINDLFVDVQNHPNVGAIFRTDIPGNNMIWSHDLYLRSTGKALPLEWVSQLFKVYKEDPEKVKGLRFNIQSTEDPTKTVEMEIVEMNELDLYSMMDTMGYSEDTQSPVFFRTDMLGLSDESRQEDVVHLTTCSGIIDWSDPNVASNRTILSARRVR